MNASSAAAALNRPLSNTNILAERTLLAPHELRRRYPRSNAATDTIEAGRAAVEAILDRRDDRLLVVVGPCSIHDPEAAKDYAQRLLALRESMGDALELVMRVYFEKPRTTVGWKGLINDPHFDDSFDIETGLSTARQLLVWLADAGMPTGTEALDPISPQYLSDLFAWSAIGARTTESQTHREMSSGLSTAVGFKNGTDGGLEVAINAMRSAAAPHAFLGIDADGKVTVLNTRGNAYGHVILRGGGGQPNYDAASIAAAEAALEKADLSARIMVDCSHANSQKDHERQTLVARDAMQQIADGNRSIIGLMIESNIGAGAQKLGPAPEPLAGLQYGVSITDACIDWSTTEQVLGELADTVRARR